MSLRGFRCKEQYTLGAVFGTHPPNSGLRGVCLKVGLTAHSSHADSTRIKDEEVRNTADCIGQVSVAVRRANARKWTTRSDWQVTARSVISGQHLGRDRTTHRGLHLSLFVREGAISTVLGAVLVKVRS